MTTELDIRHISIIDSLPIYDSNKEVLVVGAGDCKTDLHLIRHGYKVYSTDYEKETVFHDRMKDYFHELKYSYANIFNVESFPIKSCETVICAEVLEHLVEYKKAFQNLLKLTKRRLIITVPFEKSFLDPSPPPKGHCNFWSDSGNVKFKDIQEFTEMARPYTVSIQKIRTKEKDIQMKQFSYLIIIDKNQKYN